eukprot:1072619-Rhodomonas_salina.4
MDAMKDTQLTSVRHGLTSEVPNASLWEALVFRAVLTQDLAGGSCAELEVRAQASAAPGRSLRARDLRPTPLQVLSSTPIDAPRSVEITRVVFARGSEDGAEVGRASG